MIAAPLDHCLKTPAIATADIDWIDGEPVSPCFGDVYFSPGNGLAEARYAFLELNGLPERFRAMTGWRHFVVAESGFGTGLNFFATWQAWRQNASEDAVLHFVSFERNPLTKDDFESACQLWPELEPFCKPFLTHYPEPVAGLHRLVFAGGRVRLSLFYGDATDGLDQMQFTADAWFLDGFAPSKNPSLWRSEFTQALARHSRQGTTLATFTIAGTVRSNLEAAGFALTRRDGIGRKREMLCGQFQNPAINNNPETDRRSLRQGSDSTGVTIVGAGIAGSLLARNLAERGLDVEVIGTADSPADGASGNAQAAVYVKLGVDFGPETAVNLATLLYAQRFYAQRGSGGPEGGQFWHPSGLLLLATTQREQDRQRRFLARNHYPETLFSPVTATDASIRAGLALSAGGLWFPGSGWLEPVATCRWLLDHPRIRFRGATRVSAIKHSGRYWELTLQDKPPVTRERVVLAAGHMTPAFLPDGDAYRLKPIRGQVTQVPVSSIETPDCVVCGQGYLTPAQDRHTTIGATFDLSGTQYHVTDKDHRENIAMLGGFLQQPPTHLTTKDLEGRTSFRLATHDYQPIVGEIPPDTGKDETVRSLYVLSGLGSKGFALAPLLAEWLADRLTGHPECLPLNLSHRLRPSRCKRS